MKHGYHFLIQVEGVSLDPVAPPGSPRVWSALQKSIGDVECRRAQLLSIWVEDEIRPEALVRFQKALGFSGLHSIKQLAKFPALTLEVRRRGEAPDALVTTTREYMKFVLAIQGTSNVGLSRCFEFRMMNEKLDDRLLVGALEKLKSVGVRSGFFHPDSEDARISKAGDIAPWATPETPDDEQLRERLQAALRLGRWSAVRCNFRRTEYRPRLKVPLTEEVSNPLESLLPAKNRQDEKVKHLGPPEAPVSFIVSLARERDSYSTPEKFRHRLELHSSMMDRSVGVVVFRESNPGVTLVESWGGTPLNNSILMPPDAASELCIVGPWDSRNPVDERRSELFLRDFSRDEVSSFGVIDGEQDFLAYLFSLLRQAGRKSQVRHSVLQELVVLNDRRAHPQRLFVAWTKSAEKLTKQAASIGIRAETFARVSALGSDVEVVEMFEKQVKFVLPGSELEAENIFRSQPRQTRWDYPELKSPTYGFDRAAVHPDEYMMKVLVKEKAEHQWNRELALGLSGERFRSILSRHAGCSPFQAYKWTDGKTVFCESFGSQESWMQVDPRAAGSAAFDRALRGMVALGARPTEGEASFWVSQPEGAEEAIDETGWAAYLLALEGALSFAHTFNFVMRSLNGGGLSLPGMNSEIFAQTRCEMDRKAGQSFPGFRMTGEVLYMVGPKPAFMDSGSRILGHITRVISNHVSRLVPEAQLELYLLMYDLIQAGMITSIRPIGEGGLAAAVGEMSLWGGIGVQLRPSLTVFELFSGAPGRFVVGILPQEAKRFEALVKGELLVPLGLVGGDKVCGLQVAELKDRRIRGSGEDLQ